MKMSFSRKVSESTLEQSIQLMDLQKIS